MLVADWDDVLVMGQTTGTAAEFMALPGSKIIFHLLFKKSKNAMKNLIIFK
jgi:hypothetical protein